MRGRAFVARDSALQASDWVEREVAEWREELGAGGIRDETGGAGFFAGGEVLLVGGIAVVDGGEDVDDFTAIEFLVVESVVGEDFGREGRVTQRSPRLRHRAHRGRERRL